MTMLMPTPVPASTPLVQRRRRAKRNSRTLHVVFLLATVALAAGCSKREETIPADATARSVWLQSPTAAKLSEDEQRLMKRFIARLDAQAVRGDGTPASTVSVPHALEAQAAYENSVKQAQTRLEEQLGQLKNEVTLEVVEPRVVKAAPPAASGDKALSYVVRVNNRGKRIVDHVAMRIEIREATGKYQAAIPSLDLAGPLRPGQVGRSTRTLALDPALHRYILEGKPLQINAYPLEIAFADGTKLVPGDELKALETLHHAKVE
jgi:hypothetical protein